MKIVPLRTLFPFRSEDGSVASSPEGGPPQSVGGAVESVADISQSLELKVSSRPAMIVSLMDNSTETFWESGEEDRNRGKWVTVALPSAGATEGDGIKTVAIHIDNGRDMGNKVASVTFKGGNSSDNLTLLKQADVESR